jgi:hypothetical protein
MTICGFYSHRSIWTCGKLVQSSYAPGYDVHTIFTVKTLLACSSMCHRYDSSPPIYSYRHSYLTGFPAIGLFALGQRRFSAAVAAATTIIVIGACIVPYRECEYSSFFLLIDTYSGIAWGRIIANQIVFHGFLIYIHWSREMVSSIQFEEKFSKLINCSRIEIDSL